MTQTAVTQGPQQLPATWDLVAPTYAEDVAQWTAYADEAIRTVPIQPTFRVLDVACGPGTLSFVAAKTAARVDAVDFSAGMIEQLRARAAREGTRNIETAVMDAQALEFGDATFDAAFCLFGFFFFPDRDRAFRELLRVLKPGARALVATWAPIERRPMMKVGFDAVAEALPQFPRPAKGDLQDPAECVGEMSAAGFRDVEARSFTASMRIDSPEHYVDIIVRSGAPFAAMRTKLGESAWLQTRAKIVDAVKKRIPAEGVELSAEAILTTGSR